MRKLFSTLSSSLEGRIKAGLLSLALFASASAVYASYTDVDGIWYDFDSATNTASVTYKGDHGGDYSNEYYGSVIIPKTVTYNGTTYSVTSIGESAFSRCSDLTSVYIGNSVISIGECAFYDCSSLTSVTIGNSVTNIGYRAFESCSSLTSVTIPNGVTSIGYWAFRGCSSITSITIPKSITSIGRETFQDCSFTSVVWNAKKCTDIPDNGYAPFENITSITFGDSVEHIPAYLCWNINNLTSISIPKSVTSIGEGAFGKCNSLTSVVWEAKNCADFDGWYLPFCYNDNITSFLFGDSVIHIPAQVCSGMNNLTFLTIGNNVTSIGKGAFSACASLTSVTIPKSVTSIGEDAFAYCSSIDTVVWNAKNCTDFNDYSYPPFFYSDSIASFTFGDSVEHIPADLCYDMENLTSITIPNSVTSIGEYAFSGCSSLTSVTIPNSVTSVEKYAFSYCSSVTSLTLGENLASIGEGAFTWLHALTSVTQKAPSIEAYCKGHVSKLLYNSASLNKNAIRTIEINGEEVTDWVIPNSITKIEDYTFYNCPSITSVALSKTITSIGEYAFENCTSITAISIPNKVTHIGKWAFSKCPLTNVTIPNKVTNIGSSAFNNCNKLSSVILGESVDSIGGGAFYGCRKLYDIYCYASEPPYAIASGWSPSFENFNVNLYVPCDNLKAFQMDPVFGTFKYIHCIDSEDVPADGVIITPGFTDVTITWPTDDDADNYIIVIEKDGEVFCTLTFNAEGQLLNIAFAPGRDGNHPAQYAEQAGKGYRFTVTGLNEGTHYTYNIDVKDASNKTIKSHSGEFTTQSTTAVDNITTNNANIQKIIRDGQFIILRDGIEYNAMGAEIQ